MPNHFISASIICNTVAKRDNIYNAIVDYLAGKPVWQNQVSLGKGIDPSTGKPTVNLTIRFEQLAHKDAVFSAIKTKVQALTGVSIRLTKHTCTHLEDNRPCVNEEVFLK